jgi:hypothetical protein
MCFHSNIENMDIRNIHHKQSNSVDISELINQNSSSRRILGINKIDLIYYIYFKSKRQSNKFHNDICHSVLIQIYNFIFGITSIIVDQKIDDIHYCIKSMNRYCFVLFPFYNLLFSNFCMRNQKSRCKNFHIGHTHSDYSLLAKPNSEITCTVGIKRD